MKKKLSVTQHEDIAAKLREAERTLTDILNVYAEEYLKASLQDTVIRVANSIRNLRVIGFENKYIKDGHDGQLSPYTNRSKEHSS